MNTDKNVKLIKKISKFAKKQKMIIASIPLIILAVLLIYLLVWKLFIINGSFDVGSGLSKNDWLAFLGSYLGFVGTIFLGSVALLQNSKFRNYEDRRRINERFNDIQPLFIIEMNGINVQLPGTAEVLFTKHDNFCLRITNIGKFPVANVIIFNSYWIDYLKSDETKEVYCVYPNSIDLKNHPNKVIIVDNIDEFYKDDIGYPKEINLGYYDYDGNSVCKIFKLFKMENRPFYAADEVIRC